MKSASQLVVFTFLFAAAHIPADDSITYSRQIKPIFAKHCYECHGSKERESGLRMDTIASILKGGARGPAAIDGKSDESILIRTIDGSDDDLKMPPEGPLLTAAEIKMISAWIANGMKGPAEELVVEDDPRLDHWSWQPVHRPRLPAVSNTEWCRTAIDRFILARLEKAKIKPSPPADRLTLIRRLSFDLLGLPPTIQQVDQFLADDRPGAYERLVERLLASPHFGERWGRHWLDLARYGDSNGFTIDSARSIWMYRDWVIKSLNANMPFDQFVIEQIAGDMLSSPTQDQLVATGFHRNTLRNEEGGTDQEQFRVEAVVDRVNTSGSVFLGLTIGCAQCHDHKYDPISQREYYQIFALLNNASEPQLDLPTDAQKARRTELAAQLKQATTALSDFDVKAYPEWISHIAAGKIATWRTLEPTEFESSASATITKLDDKSLLVAGGDRSKQDVYTVVVDAPLKGVTAVRLEVLTHDQLPSKGPGLAANGNFVLSGFELVSGDTNVEWSGASVDFAQDAFKIAGTIDGNPKTGWGIYGGTSKNHTAIFETKRPVETDGNVVFTLRHDAYSPTYKVGRFRLSATTSPQASLSGVSDDILTAAQTPAEKRTKKQRDLLLSTYQASSSQRKELQNSVDAIKRSQAALKKQIPTTLVMRESSPRTTHVHIRGNFLSKGAQVSPGVPSVLPGLSTDIEKPDRLHLAQWFVDRQNPLTARVTVNRFWQRFFGVGLVETENDFGIQGTPPTHPELLDWLADEFVRRDWDVKALHRLIVNSSVYQMSSHVRRDLVVVDPKNKLIARQRRLRLEAEVVRDAALAATGTLSNRIGGPSVYPPQPKGIDLFTQAKKNWRDSQGSSRFRRGMYTFFWRSNPHPFLMVFDAPDGNSACTRRVSSNTPLQALTLANDTTFVELSQSLATRVLTDIPADINRRVDYAFRRCFGRVPANFERDVLLEFLAEQQNEYSAKPDDAKAFATPIRPEHVSQSDAAAWTAVARLLLNLDEFITRE